MCRGIAAYNDVRVNIWHYRGGLTATYITNLLNDSNWLWNNNVLSTVCPCTDGVFIRTHRPHTDYFFEFSAYEEYNEFVFTNDTVVVWKPMTDDHYEGLVLHFSTKKSAVMFYSLYATDYEV